MSQNINEQSINEGQAIYSKSVLAVYDIGVLGLSNSFFWRCPTKYLKQVFIENRTDNHLDVGVGTGYYLEKCLPSTQQRIGLMDLNPTSLQTAAKRVKALQPETYQQDVFKPIKENIALFDSMSLHYLLHCLPGTIKEKGIIFDNLLPCLSDNAVVFGSTILGESMDKNAVAKRLMAFYNKKGVFHNRLDTVDDLNTTLNQYFQSVAIEVKGCVAIFKAKNKKHV